MAKNTSILVEQYGNVYALSPARYLRLLDLIKTGREYDLGKLGRDLGTVQASPLGMTAQEAAEKAQAFSMRRSDSVTDQGEQS